MNRTKYGRSFFVREEIRLNFQEAFILRMYLALVPEIYCFVSWKKQKMSRRMGKPAICICENKDTDQLRSKCEADQRLCFRYTNSTIPLLSKSKTSSLYPSSVTVQLDLCRTWSEPKLLFFSRTGSYIPGTSLQKFHIPAITIYHEILDIIGCFIHNCIWKPCVCTAHYSLFCH